MIMREKLYLGVNVDHIATLRQARGTKYPSPIEAALHAEKGGADSITLHLREDRRHIQDSDVYDLKAAIKTHINLEMAVTKEMIEIAKDVKPSDCCLVPEKREELTTEGGLDVLGNKDKISNANYELAENGIRVSLFIDPDFNQIDAAATIGVPVIELHTGLYADADPINSNKELAKIVDSVEYAKKLGLIVHAGHGLNYENIIPIAKIKDIKELNIGHAIVAFSTYVGIESAVRRMKELMINARQLD